MFWYGTGRSGERRIAYLVIALAAVACRKHEVPRPLDAAPAPVDAVAIDAAVATADAAVKAAPVATKLVASGDSTCAVMSDLTVRCWGDNAHGQLGNGTTTAAATPTTPEIRAVKDLQLVDGTACALLDDASVACWGRIGWHGRAEDVLRPTGVLGVIGVVRLFVFGGRACARVANDALVCWGDVDARGHFIAGPAGRAPTPVVGLDHVAGVLVDGAFSDDGRLWTWARDGAPKLVDVTGVQEIGDREGTVCGRLPNGHVVCAPSDRCGPRHASPPKPDKPVTAPKPGKANKTAKTAKNGKPAKAGKAAKATKPPPSGAATGGPAREPAEALGFTPARQLAFDIGFCVVTTDGKLVCGDGCRRIDAPKLEHVDAVVGRCALLTSGAVTCFDGGKAVTVSSITRANPLGVGAAHACAIAGGRIICWGGDDHHQLGEFALAR
jgi:hypothetical protein